MGRNELKSVLLWAMLLLSVLVFLPFTNSAEKSASAALSGDPPIHIHLTWGQDDTAHTIVVTWKTLYENAGDNVLYDIQSRGGDPDNYDYSTVGSHHTYSGAGGYIHDVELTGLSPNAVYYFICGGENGGWSEERSFRTAPDQPTAFRFVAGGDSRSGGTWPGPRDDVSRTMAKFNPSFVLFSGDLVRQGDYQWEWDNWFAAVREYWVDNDNLTIPIIPCIGNHELYGDPNGVAYYGQFCLPENEEWYSLDWGPDLHIIVLNSETSISGKQRDWLQQDLVAHKNCKWKIAIFHRPAYSGGSHGGNDQIKTYWAPLFDNYHVDLVISGHDHDYERTYPIYQDNVQPSPENGTVYIVSGGWGAPLYGGSPGWWTAYGPDSKYHFVVIDIFENNTLYLQAVGTNGETFDELYIQEDYDVDVSISPHENSGLPGTVFTYTITVRNVGIFDDNYALTVSDDAGWDPTIDNNLLGVPASQNRTTTLSVTIPENVVMYTEDNIIVTATSQADNMASDNASCIARAVPGLSLATGWNMVGFTGVGENDTPNNVFAGLDYYTDYYIYYWTAPGGPYGLHGPDQVLEDNLGYWVWIDRDNTVTASGAPPDNREIHMENGWNLVSFPAVDENTTPNNVFTGLAYYTDYFIYYWSAPGGPYGLQGPDQVLEDDLGYWVWIDRDKTVTVP